MRFRLLSALGFLLAGCVPGAPARAATYYIDSAAGNDASADPTSPATPWKSLAPLAARRFSPGDRILLKGGSLFRAQLAIGPQNGSGEAGRPIVVDRYGEGSRPILDSGRAEGPVVHVANVSHWEITGLEVTTATATADGNRQGFLVEARDFGVMTHVYIRDCVIRDIRGDGTKKTGGIFYTVTGKAVPSRFHDVRVEDNRLVNVARSGMRIIHDASAEKFGIPDPAPPPLGQGDVLSTGIVIRNNVLQHIAGDGIVARFSIGTLVEHNLVDDSGRSSLDHNAGLWAFRSLATVFQHNEVSNTRKLGGNKDGTALDVDFDADGTVFQYNYTHGNAGGFLLVMGAGEAGRAGPRNAVVRYNVSRNDRLRVMSMARDVTQDANFQFYNNTFFLGDDLRAVVDSNDNPAEGEDISPFTFSNNIFYRGAGRIARFFHPTFRNSPEQPLHRGTWNANVFHDLRVDDLPQHGAGNRTEDPRFVHPGEAGAAAYRLQSDTPYASNGEKVAGHGGRDFFGAPLPDQRPTRGAVQWGSEPQANADPAASAEAAVDAGPAVMYVNGSAISAREFQLALREEAAPVFGHFAEAYGATDSEDFWTRRFGPDGEVPVERARQQAGTTLKRWKIEQLLARELGIAGDTNYAATLTAWSRENRRRQGAPDKRGIVAGPIAYEESDYADHTRSQWREQLLGTWMRREAPASREELEKIYETEKAACAARGITIVPFLDAEPELRLRHARETLDAELSRRVLNAAVSVIPEVYQRMGVR